MKATLPSDSPVFLRKIQESDWAFLYKISHAVPHSYFALEETTGRLSLAEIITQQKNPQREEVVGVSREGGHLLFLARTVGAHLVDRTLSFQFMILPGAEAHPGDVTEAFSVYCDAVITKLNFKRLHTELVPGETKERQLLESLQFKPEGRLRDHLFLSGRYVDLEVFGLLAE